MLITAVSLYTFPTVLLLYFVRKYRESKWGKCKNDVRLNGKVVIVTGANSGIGFHTAKELAARNAQVILACRNINNAKTAAEKIKNELSRDPTLIPMVLDLASLMSVKDFAKKIKENYPKVDILINNAGVSFPKGQMLQTQDGFEIHFGVNHLGHFYLTNMLEDCLSKAKGRVIVVASSLHEKGKIDTNNLNSLNKINENLYANSKLANVYFAQELARRTQAKGIKVYAVCPGWCYSGLFRYAMKWYHYILVLPIAFLFMRSSKEGSQTPIYCATEPSLENETGLLYRDCAHYRSNTIFYDKVAQELWEKSDKMIREAIENPYEYQTIKPLPNKRPPNFEML